MLQEKYSEYSPAPVNDTLTEGIREDKNNKTFFKKRNGCPLCASKAVINYKNPKVLEKVISEGGRILPSRITNICSVHQRQLRKSIKISRILALLPFVLQK